MSFDDLSIILDMSVEDRAREIVAKELETDAGQIRLDSKLREDLGGDSLNLVELIMRVEEAF